MFCSVVRRVALPGAMLATDGLLETFLAILGEMTIAVVLTLLDAIWHIPAPYIPFD